MKKTALIGSIFFALPALVFAQAKPELSYFGEFIQAIGNFVNMSIPILIGIGLLVFFWGLIQYIRKPEAAEGRKIMIAGLVGLFIMVSVWGIISLAQGIFQVKGDSSDVNTPSIPDQK
ncbi:MAG: hypothetical protein KBD50_01195 [Candidatus Pacebacteria bacterium]|nr:hypothetical protein [Candidatus Paceibacterota bacterium]